MLKDYFNTSSDHYIYYKNDVVRWLNGCLPTRKVSLWEESVRIENMSADMCSLSSTIKTNCVFEGKMNSSIEYFKLLLRDAESLCPPETNSVSETCIIIISSVIIMLYIVLVVVLLYFYYRESNGCRYCGFTNTFYIVRDCTNIVVWIVMSPRTLFIEIVCFLYCFFE